MSSKTHIYQGMNGYKHKRSPRNGDSSSTEPFILLITRMTGSIHHASYGDLADPQNCVLVNFSGVKGFLPSDRRKDTYGDLQGSPKPFPTRETPDKHLGPPKCLPDGNRNVGNHRTSSKTLTQKYQELDQIMCIKIRYNHYFKIYMAVYLG